MSDQPIRPAAIPFDSELARRADAPRHLPERIASTVMYYAGPEIAATAAVGGVGAIVLHPLVLPVVGALAAAHAAYAEYAARRAARLHRARASTDALGQDGDTLTDHDTAADDVEQVRGAA